MKDKTIKLPKITVRKHLCDFLKQDTDSIILKGDDWQCDILNFRTSVAGKDSIKRLKRQATEWEAIFQLNN